MPRLANVYQWLVDVDKRTRSDLLQRVLFRFSLPVFELHNFCFKLSYALGESRLFLLTGECNATDVKQLYVDLGYCGRKLTGISKLFRRLDDLKQGFGTGNGGLNLCVHTTLPLSANAKVEPTAPEPNHD